MNFWRWELKPVRRNPNFGDLRERDPSQSSIKVTIMTLVLFFQNPTTHYSFAFGGDRGGEGESYEMRNHGRHSSKLLFLRVEWRRKKNPTNSNGNISVCTRSDPHQCDRQLDPSPCCLVTGPDPNRVGPSSSWEGRGFNTNARTWRSSLVRGTWMESNRIDSPQRTSHEVSSLQIGQETGHTQKKTKEQ